MLKRFKNKEKTARDTYKIILYNQDKFEEGIPTEDCKIAEREVDFIPRVDDTLVIGLKPYIVEGVSHELDGLVNDIYITASVATD